MRVKLLCSWQNPKQLCDEWSHLCDEDYKYKDIQITWEDEADYYVILNHPQKREFFIPERTIIFQMEPSVAIKNWGEWSFPDENKFLFVGTHKNCLNNVQLQMRNIYKDDITIQKIDKISTILSSKNFDPGHIKRINFVKELEKRNIFLIDIYGGQNYHQFINYKGKVPENKIPHDEKEKCMVGYKYYFQAENNSEYNYATEKIWEPIVCECLCFYWGCPNLEDYLHPLSFVRLNLDNIEESISIIQQAINEDWWSQRIHIIRQEKYKILNELGFFPKLKKIIDNHKNGKDIYK